MGRMGAAAEYHASNPPTFVFSSLVVDSTYTTVVTMKRSMRSQVLLLLSLCSGGAANAQALDGKCGDSSCEAND